MKEKSKYLNFWKPLADKIVALLLLFLLAPVMGLIALILFLSGTPIFFYHLRPGYQGRLFHLLKFTTMTNGGSDWFGSLLRKSSIDELPQLFNILKGEMSFVGPRPLLIEYLKEYSDDEHRRHEVMPGITGFAQINGRNHLMLKEKLQKDLYYVDHVSFWLDLVILMKTARRVFDTSGADYHNMEYGRGE